MQRAAVWEETNGENGEGERGWLGPCSSYAAEREKNTEKRYFRRTKKKRKEMPETAEREVGRRPQKIIMRVTPDSSYSSVEEEEEKREGRGGGAATTAATEEDVKKKAKEGKLRRPPSTSSNIRRRRRRDALEREHCRKLTLKANSFILGQYRGPTRYLFLPRNPCRQHGRGLLGSRQRPLIRGLDRVLFCSFRFFYGRKRKRCETRQCKLTLEVFFSFGDAFPRLFLRCRDDHNFTADQIAVA